MLLSLYLLGPFRVMMQRNRALSLTSKKAQALLAYLAVEGAQPRYREALSGLLWADHPDRAARGSLRQALQDLRRAIGDDTASSPLLIASRETIQLNPEADLWVDLATFEELAAIGNRQSAAAHEATEEALQSAIALYRGPFLSGFSIGDSPAFEEWLFLRREQLGQQVFLILNSLVALCEKRAAYDEAVDYARRAIELEPWQEETHRRMMRLLALSGQRNAAIEHFRRFEQLMQRDLAVRPDPETIALYESIRDGAIMTRPPIPPTSAQGGEPRPLQVVLADSVTVPILVGRESELEKLDGLLSQALAGDGRVALVTGEAGSGKTALVEGFARQAMATQGGLLVTLGRCSAHSGAGDAYQPFREIMWILTGDPEGVLSSQHAQRLQGALPLAFEALAQQGPDLARLLARDPQLVARARSCALPGSAWLATLEVLNAKADSPIAMGLQPPALCEQAARVLQAVARRRPLLVLLDDLQWADAPSLDMLFHLGRRLQGHRILIVGTFRTGEPDSQSLPRQRPLSGIADEFQRQWGDIRVDLTQAEGRRFVDAYIDGWPNRLGASFRETLFRHTGGNALFAVELVRAMQERGHLLRDGQGRWIEGPTLTWKQLPPRVEGAVSQRIGQLTAAQNELLEVASVEGEEFHAEVLARVLGLSAEAVTASLSGPLGKQARLVTPGSIVRFGERQLARYHFRHGMFQSHLYGRLDAAVRARLHGAVGAALEELYGEQASRHAGQLAWHFEAAGQSGKAASYLLKAGQQAAWVGAHHEAIGCYERALALVPGLPTAAERIELEFALRMTLDRSLLVTLGWGAGERLRAFGRAYELGQQMGWSTPAMLSALRSMADLSAARGEYDRAIHLANELLIAAERVSDPLYVASAHAILSLCSVMQGDLSHAWEHVSYATAFCRNPPHRLAAEEMQALCPNSDIAESFLLLSKGNLDQARQQMDRITAREDWDIAQRTVSLCTAAILYALLHEDRKAQERAEEALRIIGSQDLPELRAWAEGVLGWAEARDGQFRQGIVRLTTNMKAQLERSTLTFRFLFPALLSEAYLAGGETVLASRTVAQALSQIEETGTRYVEAEMWRLRGDIVLQDGQTTAGSATQEAKVCFSRAVEIAQRQDARLWELRATVRLARLWMQEGRSQEAQAALSTLYATFSEGFDTPDLTEARALLQDLSPI